MSQSSIRTLPESGRLMPGDDVQQRRLAAAAAADQHHLLAGRHAKLGNIQHRQRSAIRLPKRLFQVFQVKHDEISIVPLGDGRVTEILRQSCPLMWADMNDLNLTLHG